MKKKSLILALTPFVLISCGGSPAITSSSSNPTESSQSSVTINDVKSAVEVLANDWNYEVIFSYEDDEYSRFYRDDYVIDYQENKGWGYALVEGAIHHLTPVNDEVRLGQVVEGVTSLKELDIPSLALLDTSLFEVGQTSVTLNKINSLALISFFGLSETEYLNLEDASLTYFDKGAIILTGDLAFNDGSIAGFSIINVGNASSSQAEAAITNPYSIPEDVLTAKSLFSLNNYTRNVYDETTLAGQEVYMPRYFYNRYLDGSNISSGIASFKDTTYTEGTNSTYLDGCYYFYLNNDQVVFNFGGIYTRGNDVVTSMFYPSLLSFWETPEVFTFSENKYTITRQDYLDEFVRWTQLSDSFTEGTYVARFINLYVNSILEGAEELTLTLGYSAPNGSLYEIEYNFVNFNSSNIEAVDTAIEAIDNSSN